MRISVISDSLSMGRIDYDKNKKLDDILIPHYSCWINNLKHNQVYTNARRERTTEYLNTEECFYESIELTNPEIIIIQLGVVDCAPRVISLMERKIINTYFFPKFIRERMIKNRSKNREKIISKNPLSKVYVKFPRFRENLMSFIKKAKDIQIIFIPIIYNDKRLNPHFVSNCILYNQIIEDICNSNVNCKIVDTHNLITNSKNFCLDGYHLSELGHSFISNSINKLI